MGFGQLVFHISFIPRVIEKSCNDPYRHRVNSHGLFGELYHRVMHMGLFEELERRKASGEQLSLDDLTREDLRKIWYEEVNTDKTIAKLFDVKPYRVTAKRREMGLMWHDLQWEAVTDTLKDLFEKYNDELKEELHKRKDEE